MVVISENSALHELIASESSRALVLVPWLWSPEKELLSYIRKEKETVDLTRKFINYLIPFKGEGRYITSRTSFNPSKSNKIFMINCAKLPFIPITRVYKFFAMLGFREEQIDIIFLFRSIREARNLNRSAKKKYSDFSLLDNHVYSANQLHEFLFCGKGLLDETVAEMTGNADIIFTDNILTKVIVDKNGKFEVNKGNQPYPLIPLKREGMKYPAKELYYWIAEYVKLHSPYTRDNEFYGIERSSEELAEEFEVLRDAQNAFHLAVRSVDDNYVPLQKTEEDQYELDQNLLAAELKLQETFADIVGKYPVKEPTREERFRDIFRDSW